MPKRSFPHFDEKKARVGVRVRACECVRGVRARVAALLDISVYMYLGSGRRRGVFRLISFLYFAHQCPDLYIVYVCIIHIYYVLKSQPIPHMHFLRIPTNINRASKLASIPHICEYVHI